MQSLSELVKQAESEIGRWCHSILAALDAVRVKYLGKKGELTARLKGLSTLSAEERPAAGQEINEAKKERFRSNSMPGVIALQHERNALAEKLRRADAVDVSLPGRGTVTRGGRHPVLKRRWHVSRNIPSMPALVVRTGPEIEDDFHNFHGLNIPENHPARAMHDTFYFPGGNLLRTHTSPVQIRSMVEEGVPIRIIAPGRVFIACDSAIRLIRLCFTRSRDW